MGQPLLNSVVPALSLMMYLTALDYETPHLLYESSVWEGVAMVTKQGNFN